MRSRFLLVALVSALVFGLAACGSRETASDTTTTPPASSESSSAPSRVTTATGSPGETPQETAPGRIVLTAALKGQLDAEEWAKLLNENPQDADSMLGLANAYHDAYVQAESKADPVAAEALGEAITLYSRYLALIPDDADARADYASALYSAKRVDDAITELQRVVAENPAHVNATYNLGIIYWQAKGDVKTAQSYIEKAISIVGASSEQGKQMQAVLGKMLKG